MINKFKNNKLIKIEEFILGDYIFCYHEKFKKTSSINEVRFLKGLDYFLSGYNQNQTEIIKFIDYKKDLGTHAASFGAWDDFGGLAKRDDK